MAHDAVNHEYLVVWTADTLIPFSHVDDEFESWGQLYAGGLIDSDGFKSKGTGGGPWFIPHRPAIVSTRNPPASGRGDVVSI
ncbi:MAG: hypothetical protein V2I67_11070 [Thermoanaerobaculales bacterium]|nr:hypothetical protein [Thermoanaerobaculales bacterium]